MDKKKQISWLYITVFINILGFGIIFPILPLFAETFQASYLQIGLLAAAFSLAQFLSSPFLGRLSDRFGRKPILVFSIIGSIMAFLIMAGAKNLEIIFLSRILHGIASAGNFPIAQAYIADITPKKERPIYMGRVSAMFALGFVFGPVFGGVLGSLGFSPAFLAGAVISLLNLLVVLFFLPESLSIKAENIILREGFLNFKAIYHGLRGDFGILFFLLFSWAFYISNFQVTIPLFTEHKFSMDTFENGLFFSATGIAASISQWFILPLIIKRVGELKTIFAGILLMIIGQVLAPLSGQVTLFYLFFIISIVGSSLKRPTVNAVLSEKTHEGQGTTMGLAFSFESLGRVVGPLLAGIIIQKFDLAYPFWLTAIVLLIGLFLFWKFELKKSR